MNDDKIKELEKRNQELEATLMSAAMVNRSDEIDLSELWNIIWKAKLWVMGITLIFSIAAVFYALSMPDQYKSTAILMPASTSSSSSLSKLAGKFGGLASLAGINLGAGGREDKSIIAIEVIKTWDFLETFIEENNIEVEVFAANGWNRANNQLLINPKLYDIDSKTWVRDFDASRGQKAKPSGWELYEKFIEKISINKDEQTDLTNISIEFYSPTLAKEWTDKLIKAINAHIQKQDRDEATKSIEYLNKKINETDISDMQTVFFQLIEEQTKTLMLAEVSEEYVFKTLSPAKVPVEKSKPKRAFIAILGFFLGGILSIVIVLFRHYSAKDKT